MPYSNVEGLINKISAVTAEAKINIENMESKSKKDMAYTVLDVKGSTDGLMEKFKAIDAVLNVRIIK